MTTKFNIGDYVWFMYGNKPTCMPICRITIHSEPEKYNSEPGDNYGDILVWRAPSIRYSFWDCDGEMSETVWESRVFATKEELKKAVFGE